MDKLTALDKHLIDSAMEAIVVLRCLNPENMYKVECLLCQIWQTFSAEKRSWIGRRFKWLVENDYLPGLEALEKDSDGSMHYRIVD